ncbi:MAG: bifunctional diguanylate cyclase/phosphodiesterase [Pseudomonadota bacterium]|nr:bifunctional diguanylate cyclase/phosphodiesterase [Pseudomonadota bacterium]
MGDVYAITASVLLALGIFILASALFSVRDMHARARVHARVWWVLPVLTIAFIVGYVCVATLIVGQQDAGIDKLAVAAAFFWAGCFVWGMTRISQRVVREMQRIAALEHHRATYDALTSLPNRSFFVQQLQQAIAGAASQKRLAVMMMDLDRFKLINDTLGHHYGDILLQEVSIRLHGALRSSDLVARLGGDEFGILINPVDDPRHPSIIAKHVSSVLEGPFAVEGYPADVRASIGVAYHPEHGDNANILMKNAEIAMYEAKRRSVDVMAYDPVFDTHDLDRLNILSELRQAIDQAELLVHYQPQFHAHSGALAGVEALVRWPHPRLGLLLPEEFVVLAEQSGLINRLNRWVLGIVLEQLAAWRRAGIETPISTNISVVNLQDPVLYQYIADGLRAREVTPSRLRLEITETAVMSDPNTALAAVKRLSELGVRFSIDDFGTGYSSLLYLREMPLDEIKIDRSFIANLARDNNDAIIVRSTIDLAHNMGRVVTAEGVEGQQSVDLLTRWGCDKLQGFYLSPPLAIEDLNLKLSSQNWNPLPSSTANRTGLN